MGSLVLAVGLWLRFDPETVSLLNGDGAPDTFFIGEYKIHGLGEEKTEGLVCEHWGNILCLCQEWAWIVDKWWTRWRWWPHANWKTAVQTRGLGGRFLRNGNISCLRNPQKSRNEVSPFWIVKDRLKCVSLYTFIPRGGKYLLLSPLQIQSLLIRLV